MIRAIYENGKASVYVEETAPSIAKECGELTAEIVRETAAKHDYISRDEMYIEILRAIRKKRRENLKTEPYTVRYRRLPLILAIIALSEPLIKAAAVQGIILIKKLFGL